MGIASSKSNQVPAEQVVEDVVKPDCETECTDAEEASQESASYFGESDVDSQVVLGSLYHDDDSAEQDGFLESSRPRKPLTWRGAPAMGDWTLFVRPVDDNEQQLGPASSYHVHRNILALGERRCDFFAEKVFQAKETELKRSLVVLNGRHLGAFETLLDFCYDKPLKISTWTALELRTLALRFGCHALTRKVDEFIEQDVEQRKDGVLFNGLFYLEEAFAIEKCEEVFFLALNACARFFWYLGEAELYDLPMDLFRSIVTHPELPTWDTWVDVELSLRVSRYLRAFQDRGGEVTPSLLIELTDRRVFVALHRSAVNHFQELVRALEPSATEGERTALRDLCLRCWDQEQRDQLEYRSAYLATSYLEDKWDTLDWKERQLIMQLDAKFWSTRDKTARMNVNIDALGSRKRRLEDECEALRCTKRVLSMEVAICEDIPSFGRRYFRGSTRYG